jgi:pullulanase/glycogen debranching enzyme
MTEADWTDGSLRSLAVQMSGAAYSRSGPDADLLAVFNADDAPVNLQLPSASRGEAWRVLVDTARADAGEAGGLVRCRETLRVDARSTVLLEADSPGSGAGS